MKYYSLDKILATKSDINLIIGQRSNGKTYASCLYFLKEYKKTGRRFCYIRRWADDIKGFRAEQLFAPMADRIESIFGQGYQVVYYRHKYFLCDDEGVKVDIIGYALSLSEASHTKSVSYDNVGYILFDEFIQMSGEVMLRDEMLKYENTLSTIIRQKTDVKVILCANTVSKFSPYFTLYGFDINKCEQGTITTKEYPIDDGILRVSLEYCEYNEDIGKKVSKYTTSKMIRTGQWEIPETDDIPSAPNELVKDKLLFTMYEQDTDVIVGCFLRISKWKTLETDETTLLKYQKEHTREFLILRLVDRKSKYFHLSPDKSLNYHTYNELEIMLKDIKENCDIDVRHELYMGRIFCDNMFTADYFNHCWQVYDLISPRQLL